MRPYHRDTHLYGDLGKTLCGQATKSRKCTVRESEVECSACLGRLAKPTPPPRRTCVSADVTSNEGEVLVRWNFSDGTHYTMGLGSADTVASPGELTQLLEHVQALEKLAADAGHALHEVRAYLGSTEESPGAVELITDKLEELRRARAALDGVS